MLSLREACLQTLLYIQDGGTAWQPECNKCVTLAGSILTSMSRLGLSFSAKLLLLPD